MTKFPVKIILPLQTILDTEAHMVNIPGEGGMFGVLAGHMKMIASIDVGIISIFNDAVERRFFVYGGIARIDRSCLNILSDFVMEIFSDTKKMNNERVENIKSELSACNKDSPEWDILNDKLEKHMALLKFL